VKLPEFPILADENIHPDVVAFLQDQGCDVVAVRGSELVGSTDEEVLRAAVSENRLVLTHDSDFGTLAVLRGVPVVGIVYLRPGHIDPVFTIETLQVIIAENQTLTPPFILVAQRTDGDVRLRLRNL